MTKILIILTDGSLNGVKQLESITALLVFSSYGANITVCLSDDAVHLLSPIQHSHGKTVIQPFKSSKAMLESFEFYDLLPVWIDATALPAQPMIDCISMPLNAETLKQFDAVLRW